MTTPNLKLETIESTDNIRTSLLEKMNSNFSKIDTGYKSVQEKIKALEQALLEKTGKEKIEEAIEYVDNLVNAQDGTITPDKVIEGFVGYAGLDRITGELIVNKCYVSTSDPTEEDGNDNDLWLVMEE